MREEQYFDGDGQTSVKRNNYNQQNLAGPYICSAEHRIQIPEQEQRRYAKPNTNEDVIEKGDGRPRYQSDGYPDEVGVTI